MKKHLHHLKFTEDCFDDLPEPITNRCFAPGHTTIKNFKGAPKAAPVAAYTNHSLAFKKPVTMKRGLRNLSALITIMRSFFSAFFAQTSAPANFKMNKLALHDQNVIADTSLVLKRTGYRKPTTLLLGLLMMGMFVGSNVWGQNIWDGSSNTDWNTAANWSLNHVPTSGETVQIGNTANVPNQPTLSANTTINALNILGRSGTTSTRGGFLTIADGVTLTITTNLTMSGSTDNNTPGNCGMTCSGTASIAIGGNFTTNNATSGTDQPDITIGSGNITVTGNLSFSSSTPFSAGTSTFLFNSSGTQTVNNAAANDFNNINHSGTGTIQVTSNSLVTNNSFNNSGGGTVNLNGVAGNAFGDLQGNGTITNGSATAVTLAVGGGNASTTFSGVIQNGTGTVSLTKNGTGTFTLSGNNSYTGTTTISGGIIKLGQAGTSPNSPLGTTGGGTTVNSGAALDLNGFTLATAEGLTLNGTGISSTGALTNSTATAVNYSGNIALNAASSIGTNTGDITISGVISGSNNLTKVGNGTLALSGNNTYTGVTGISVGTIKLGQNGTSPNGPLGTITGSTTVTSGAALDLNGFTLATAESLTLNGTGISSTGALINSSATAANYSGAITLGSASSIGTTGNITLGANGITGSQNLEKVGGATLHLGSGTATLSGLTISAGTLTSTSGTMNLVGNFTNNATFDHNGGTVNLNGNTQSIGGTSATTFNNLTLSNTGTKTFSLATTINSSLSISSGVVANLGTGLTHSANTLTLGVAGQPNGSHGGTSATTATYKNATFFTSPGPDGIINVTTSTCVTGTWLGATSTDWNDGTNWCGGAPTSTTDVTIPSGTAFSPTISAAGAVCRNITINSGATLTISGSNTLTVSGNWSKSGTLVPNTSTVYFDAAGTQTVNNGGTGGFYAVNHSGTGTLQVITTALVTTNTFNNSGGGIVDLNGIAGANFGDLQGNGNITNNNATAVTLTTGGDNASSTFAGVIQNGTGVISLTKTGTGTLTLSGNNSYSGATSISAGTLQLGQAGTAPNGPLGTTTGGTTVSAGAALDLNGFTLATSEFLTLNGTGISGTGALVNSSSGSATYSGGITLNTGSSIGTNTGDITITGVISGGSTLTKVGTGTLTLSANNSYTGVTTISTGIIKLGATGASPNGPLGTVTGGTVISSGAVLDLNGFTLATSEGLTLNGTGISSGGALINSDASAVTYNGAITLGSAVSIGTTGDITLGAGGITGTQDLEKVGAGTLSLDGGTINLGSLLISAGALTSTSGTMNIFGNFSNNSIFNHNNGTVNFNDNNQLIDGSSANTFHNLILSNAGTKTFGSATTINGNLSIASGVVADLGTFIHTAGTLTLAGGGAPSGSWGSTSSTATHQDDTYFAATIGIVNVSNSDCNVSITPGTIPEICEGFTSFTIPYTATGNPNKYSISGADIVEVTNGVLPASPITVTLLASAVPGTIPFTLTVTNTTTGCVSAVYNGQVTVVANPSASDAGPDQTGTETCGLTTVTLAATPPAIGTGTWSVVTGTGGSFGNTSSPTSTFSGTAGSTYTLKWTISNNGCATTFDEVVITFNLRPTITTAGTLAAVCFNAGSQTTTLAYTATTNSPVSYEIDWNAAANTAGLADQGTTAFAFVAGAGTITGIPITAGTPAGIYSGTMTITNAVGCTNTQAVTVTVNPLPTITTSGTINPLCFTASAQTASLPYSATTNSPTSYSIDWVSGITDQGTTTFAFAAGGGNLNTINIPAGTVAGTYTGTMTITTAAGCTATQAVSITINPLPTISTTGTMATVCFSASAQTTTLAYTATTNSPVSYSIDWNAAANTAGLADQGTTAFTFLAGGGTLTGIVITANVPAGTYTGTMTITTGNNCTATQTVTVSVSRPTITTAGTLAAVCFNAGSQTTTLGYTATTGSPTSYSIDWSAAANTAGLADQGNTAFAFLSGAGTLTGISITAGTLPGTYTGTMTITNALNCTNTQNVTVTINPLPTIVTSGTINPLCSTTGAQTATLPYSATTNSPTSYSIDWVSGITDQGTTAFAFAAGGGNLTTIAIPAGTAAGSYTGTMTITNAAGCTATQAVSITINPTPTIATTGTMATACFSTIAQTTTLNYTATTGNPNSYSIDWNNTANGVGFADQGTTAFTFLAGGGTLTGIVISASVPAGTYTGTMTIRTAANCTATQTVTVSVNRPTITSAGTLATICFNASSQTTTLAYTATTGSPTSYSIDWNAAANTAGLADQATTAFAFAAGGGTITGIPITAGTAPGTYSGIMTITNALNCTNTQNVTVTVNRPTITTTGILAPVCFNAGAQTTTLAYTATTNSPNSYSINWDATANAAGLADQGTTSFAFAAGGGTLTGIAITAGAQPGSYSGTMTITNAQTCTNTLVTAITINVLASTAVAGPDQTICAETFAILAANQPTSGTGSWSVITGNDGSFIDAFDWGTTFFGLTGIGVVS